MANPRIWAKFLAGIHDSPLATPAVATPATKAENSTTIAMSDKNPKAKQKTQAQHEMLKKQKAEEHQREQQRLHELHMMKHPHEMKG